MKRRTKRLLARYGLLGVAVYLLITATLAALSGRVSYQNYWGGVVFAPIAVLIAILLIIVLYRDLRGDKKALKSDEQLFEGPLKDWKKW